MTRLDGVVEHLPGPLCGQSSALKPWHITQPHCRSVRAAPPGDLQRRYVPATGTRSPGIVISGLPQPQYESQIRHSQSTLQRLNPPRIDSPTPQLPIAIHRFTFILHPHRRHVFRRHLPRLPRAPLPAAAGLGQVRHLQRRLPHQHPPLHARLHPRPASLVVHHRQVPRAGLRVRGAPPGSRGRPRHLRLRPVPSRPALPAAQAAAAPRHELRHPERRRREPGSCASGAWHRECRRGKLRSPGRPTILR